MEQPEKMEQFQEDFFNEIETLYEKYHKNHPDEFFTLIGMVKVDEGIQQKIMSVNGSYSIMAEIFEKNTCEFRKKSIVEKMKKIGNRGGVLDSLKELLKEITEVDTEEETKEETEKGQNIES